MAVEYGMSLIEELKGALERRRNVSDIIGTYRINYDSFIQELKESFEGADDDTAACAIYLASYVMDTVKDRKERFTPMDESERIRIVLENLVVARNFYPVDLPSLIHIYQLIFDWATKIEKEMIKRVRLHTSRNVIIVNLVDIFAVPLFQFMKKINKEMDLRWAMAELQGAMTKEVSPLVFEDIKMAFPLSEMVAENFFMAGEYVIRPFVEKYLSTKGDRSQLEVFGDIGEKPFELAASSFYNNKTQELIMNSAFTAKFGNKVNKDLNLALKEGLNLNHPLLRKIDYKFLFAKFYIKIQSNGQFYDRRLFLHNLEGKQLGAYTFLLISAENVNMKVLDSYVKARFTDIQGLKDFAIFGDAEKATRLEDWNETYISTLQEEYDFLTEADSKREQKFLPLAIVKQEKNKSLAEIISSSSEESQKRVRKIDGIEKKDVDTLDKIKQLINFSRLIILSSLNVFRQLMINFQENENEIIIEFFPEELLFQNEKEESDNILIKSIADDSRIVSIIARNESVIRPKGLMKQRQLNSKINQLLTELRVKSLEEAVKNRLEDTGLFDFYKSVELEAGKFYFKGKVSQSVDSLDATSKIEEELKKAKIIEEERLEKLKGEEERRLRELRRIYFNETISTSLSNGLSKFLDKILLEYFDNNQENEKFKRLLNGTIDEIDEWEERKEKVFTPEISNIVSGMLSELEPKIKMVILDVLGDYFNRIKDKIDTMTTNELLEKI